MAYVNIFKRRSWLAGVLVILGAVLISAVVIRHFTMNKNGAGLDLKPLVKNEPFAVNVEFEGGSARAGQTQHAHVRVVQGEHHEPFDIYNNGYALHLVVASVDHASFLHTVDLHQDGVGTYGVDVLFGPPGKYRVWVEVNDTHGEQHHGEGAPFIGYADFRVRGQATNVASQPRVYEKEAQTGPYLVKLGHEALRAGTESEVRLTVQDAQGRVKQLLDPEPNIFVMVGPKGDAAFPFFRHGHSEPAVEGNTIVWRETFPKAGEYLLWTTVYLAGTTENQQTEAVEVPFMLTVSE